jgi:hypothetical protein
MKHICSLAIALIAFTFVFANPKITFTSSNGNWTSGSSWDLNRVPSNGDTIVIPADKTLTIGSDLALNNVHVRISGTVTIASSNTQINIDNQSDIVVYQGGKILGNLASQKIRIGGNLVYQGNQSAVYGPAMATVASIGFQSGVLPVKFLGFNVARKGSDVMVQWSTSEETGAFRYELERSFDAANWNTISYITAAGNSSNLNNYSYTDRSMGSKTAYYRVKQVDNDGKYAYTAVRSIQSDAGAAGIKLVSMQNRLVLQFPQEVKNGVTVRIISYNGQVVKEQRVEQVFGQVILNANVKGSYVISVSNGQDVNIARQLIL